MNNPKRKPRQIYQDRVSSLMGFLADDLLPIVPDQFDVDWEDYCEARRDGEGSHLDDRGEVD